MARHVCCGKAAKCRLAEVIWRHGVPRQIINDMIVQQNIYQETVQVLGVKQFPTSGGHPQMDGLVK